MRKNIVLITLISFMFVFGLQVAQPVSAAKLVDHGSIKNADPYWKESWFAYQKGTNYVKVNLFNYFGDTDQTDKWTYILQKVSKNKLKLTIYVNGEKYNVEYRHTKLTAARYYWRIFRSEMLSCV